jgi:DegV family protein with EDD domain
MAVVHIVTDSTAYLPSGLVAKLGIHQVSLYYRLGADAERRELDLDSFSPFYDELEAANEVAHTSPPSEEDFLATYEPLLAGGASVVSVHMSSGLSQTCTVARGAAERLAAEGKGGERVHVIDSAGTGGKLGMVVLAARAAAADGDGEGAARTARAARQEVQMHFLLDTLEFLRRGGRIGTAAAWIGSAMSVKPILSLESQIKAVERVRTRDRGKERLVEFARRQAAAGADAWCMHHTRAADEATELAERLGEVFWRPAEFISELGPVIGTHTGPGLLAVGAMPSRFLEQASR